MAQKEQQNQNQSQEDQGRDALQAEKDIRDNAGSHQFVIGEGLQSTVETVLEYGYLGHAPDGVGVNDANRDDNSYGGNASTKDPNVSTQQDKGVVGKEGK